MDDLYHHGVKGQKWGVLRYQNKDGSLTALGKKRRKSIYERVEGSKIRSAWHKRGAANVYAVNKKHADSKAKAANRKVKSIDKKIDKMVKRSEKGGFKNLKQATKHANKGNQLIAEANRYESIGKQYAEMSKVYSKGLKDIKDGTLKAGRDYIYKVEGNLLLNPMTYSVYDKKGKKTASYNMRMV